MYEQTILGGVIPHKITTINNNLPINIKISMAYAKFGISQRKKRLHLSNNVHIIVMCRMDVKKCQNIFVHIFWASDIPDWAGFKRVNIKSCIYSQKIIKHKIRIVYNNMSSEKTFKFSLIIYGQYLKIEFILSLQVLSALSHLSCLQESRGYGGRTEICPQPFPEQWRQARIIATI